MRLYGSSPLYSYVELIFRSKRLFIVAILLGTLITSTMVFSRPVSYEANMIISLTGDPATNAAMNELTRRSRRTEVQAVRRKADRLIFWVKNDREFVPQALRDINLDKKYSAEELDDITKRIQRRLDKPKLINGQYLNIALPWSNPAEAEQILNALYGRFASRTVAEETAAVTNRRIALQQQFDQAEKEANEAARKRTEFLTRNWWQIASRLGAELGKYDATEQRLSSTRFDLTEARMRLDSVTQELSKTDKYIVQSKSSLRIMENPVMKLTQEKEDLTKQLAQLRTRYNDAHPAIRDLQKQIAAKQTEIDEASKKGPQEKQTEIKEDKQLNPKWQQLDQVKSQLATTIRTLEFRRGELEKQLARAEANVRRIPVGEVEYSKVDRDYKYANSHRNQIQALLKTAQYDETRDKLLEKQSIGLLVPPKAEKQDTPGKIALLYALGPILGVLIAFCLSLVAEAMDHTLRTPVEVEKYLGKPVLAVLPKIPAAREGRKRLAGGHRTGITS